MELLRVHPFPLELTYNGLPVETDLTAVISDERNLVLLMLDAVSDVSGSVTFNLPPRLTNYDGEYRIKIVIPSPWTEAFISGFGEGEYGNDSDTEILILDTLSIVRPYVNPVELAPSPEQIPAYTKYERVARIMIDNVVGGFYYTEDLLDLQGVGANKLPIGRQVTRLKSVVEDGVVTYNYLLSDEDNITVYTLTPDRQSMIVEGSDGADFGNYGINPISAHDSIIGHLPTNGPFSFTDGKTYAVKIERGWPMVPQDIQEATRLLVEDASCNAPNYWSRYIREYETKDYRVDFHRAMFNGTGNLIVDQILKKYWGQTLYDNVRVL